MDTPLPDFADEPRVYGAIGVGMPELAHASVGVFVVPRLAIEARAGWVVLNPEVGLAVEGAAWSSSGGARGHVVSVTAEAMVNPALGELRLAGGGDVLAAYVGIYGGYRWMADSGFLVRARGGVLLYDDGGFAVGPNLTVGVGWAL